MNLHRGCRCIEAMHFDHPNVRHKSENRVLANMRSSLILASKRTTACMSKRASSYNVISTDQTEKEKVLGSAS